MAKPLVFKGGIFVPKLFHKVGFLDMLGDKRRFNVVYRIKVSAVLMADTVM